VAEPGIFILGAIAQGTSGAQGRSPGRGPGWRSWSSLQSRHCFCLPILTATETIKIRQFRTVHLLILDQYVSWWG